MKKIRKGINMREKIHIENLEKIFSERLKSSMKNKTQESVAKDTGITRQNLSRYIKGQSLPNSKNLFILAKYFNVSCDYLLGTIDLDSNKILNYCFINDKRTKKVYHSLSGLKKELTKIINSLETI